MAIIAQAGGMAQESKVPVFTEQFRLSLVQRRVLVLDGVLDDDNGTVLAAPTLLGFPPLLEEAHILFKLRALTSPVNAAGLPALALPVPVPGRDADPIPASVQLIGPRNGEERLLAAGALVEQAVHG